MKNTYDYLIVGAGLYGAVFAHEAKARGKRCLVVDRRSHAGGNVHCQHIDNIHVHQYGAHIFHTDNREVWQYVSRFVEFNRYTNSPIANYHGRLYNLPFNMNTFYQLWGVRTPEEAERKLAEQRAEYADIAAPANFEEQALKLCGRDIYETLIKGYTEKQWGREARLLPAEIIKRVPLRMTFDNNYFNDPYQGIPIGGYNVLIDQLLEGIDLRLDTDYFAHRAALDALAHRVVYTGRIDQFFDNVLGQLEYRSLRFDTQRMDVSNFQGNAVVNYTAADVPYTRIIEHKHFEFGQQPTTVVTYEYPAAWQEGAEPYYPVNDERNNRLAQAYREMAQQQQQRVLFGGRLGQYAYFDMDDTVREALAAAKRWL